MQHPGITLVSHLPLVLLQVCAVHGFRSSGKPHSLSWVQQPGVTAPLHLPLLSQVVLPVQGEPSSHALPTWMLHSPVFLPASQTWQPALWLAPSA